MDTYLIGALSGFGPRDRYELDNALHAPHTDELFNVAYIAPDWDGKADHYVLVNARNLAAFERQAVAFHKESSRWPKAVLYVSQGEARFPAGAWRITDMVIGSDNTSLLRDFMRCPQIADINTIVSQIPDELLAIYAQTGVDVSDLPADALVTLEADLGTLLSNPVFRRRFDPQLSDELRRHRRRFTPTRVQYLQNLRATLDPKLAASKQKHEHFNRLIQSIQSAAQSGTGSSPELVAALAALMMDQDGDEEMGGFADLFSRISSGVDFNDRVYDPSLFAANGHRRGMGY